MDKLGVSDGIADGSMLKLGDVVGKLLGSCDNDGLVVGDSDGIWLKLGDAVGLLLGMADNDGIPVGCLDGDCDGSKLKDGSGVPSGVGTLETLGCWLKLGDEDGPLLGSFDNEGLAVGD